MTNQGRSAPNIDLSIVIPAWNERENLELLLPALEQIVAELGLKAEVIVADAGSADGTADCCKRFGSKLVVQQERGYGGALLAGFKASSGAFIVTMDADLSHPAQFVSELWRRRQEADVLIASRYVPGGAADMNQGRRILSFILNRVFAIVLWLPFKDLSSGFRLYRREIVASLPLVGRDFDVLEEILIRIYAGGGSIREVPFHYKPRGAGSSHARLFKFAIAYLRTLGRMIALRLGGRPN